MEYTTLIALVVGFYSGYKVSEWIQLWMLKQILKDLGITHEQLTKLHKNLAEQLGTDVPEANDAAADTEEELPKVAMLVEQVGDMLYAYQKDTGRFLGQAASAEALIQRLADQRHDITYTVSREDGGLLLGGINWEYDMATKQITKAGDQG